MPLYLTNPIAAHGVAPNIHNQDNVSIPKNGLNIKNKNIAITHERIEKMNCLKDNPK